MDATGTARLLHPWRGPGFRFDALRRRAVTGDRGNAAWIALSLVVALSAIAGGVALVAGGAAPPRLLRHTPFASFVVPGLLLAIGVGGTSLLAAVLAWRRSRYRVDAMFLAGGTLTVWLGVELALLRELAWLQVVYGALGVAMLGVAVRAAWRSRNRRQRWVMTVTAAETLGYAAPACAGIATAQLGIEGVAQALVLGAAGCVEGFALGTGQVLALPIRVRRVRFALLTAAGAGATWLAVMTLMLVGGAGRVPVPAVIAASLGIGAVALLSIGTLQWLELRTVARHPRRWIAWTALAWTLALPLSFAPSPLVDAATPLAVNVVLWLAGGAVMAYVMALVTWQGARRL